MMGLRAASIAMLLFTANVSIGCGSNTPSGVTGTGGEAASSAGGAATGGHLSSGGSSGSGGNVGGAGSSCSGGTSSVGGSEASGGSSASGGSQGSGGSPGSGGDSGKSDAGTSASGGRADASQGGSTSTGGSGPGGTLTGGGSGGGGTTALGGATGTGGATSSTFWPNAYKATTGASGMNTGQDCMSSCHNHGFAFGGTVYDSSGKPKSQVEIGIKPTNGQFVSVFSGGDGNFHYSGMGLNLAGADIRIRDSNGESQMPVNPSSSGGCNSCHTGTATGSPRIAAP